MKIAYLTNQYPKTSHSFIRREIAALEALGFAVDRYSIRSCREPLVHAEDVAEAARTRVILERSAIGVATAIAVAFVTRPLRCARSLGTAVRLGRRSDRGIARHLAYWVEACVLLRWMQARGTEHLHAHFGTNPPVVALLARELGGPTYSFTVHGVDGEFPEVLSLREKIESARFVVAVSSYGRSQLVRSCPTEQMQKLHLVRCGLDEAFLRAEAAPLPDTSRLVCVARLSKEKGHLVLLDALARLKAEGTPFEVQLVGDGDLRPAIESEIARLGLAPHVHLRGWLDEAELRAEIRAARALVLPSFSEGLPVALMEALALERPVLSTYIAGIPELVVPRENGWLVPAGAVEPLVAALRELLRMPIAELASMGRRGRARVALQHDAAAEAQKLARLFRGECGVVADGVASVRALATAA